jgi:hypothetical protein
LKSLKRLRIKIQTRIRTITFDLTGIKAEKYRDKGLTLKRITVQRNYENCFKKSYRVSAKQIYLKRGLVRKITKEYAKLVHISTEKFKRLQMFDLKSKSQRNFVINVVTTQHTVQCTSKIV